MAAHRHRLRVRYSDCDPQGVLFNANYLTYFDIGVTELWREALGSYEEMHELGVDLVVAEATLRFRAPVRFDQEVDLLVAVAAAGTTSIGLSFELVLVDGGTLAAEGEMRHVFVSLGSSEKTPIPESVRRALAPFAAEDTSAG